MRLGYRRGGVRTSAWKQGLQRAAGAEGPRRKRVVWWVAAPWSLASHSLFPAVVAG